MMGRPHSLIGICVVLTGLANAISLQAQLPVVRGESVAQTGMIYYDHATANDHRERIYRYTLHPASAACMSLDFNLVGAGNPGDSVMDFVQVYAGEPGASAPMHTLGAASGSRLVQCPGTALTIEFHRTGTARNTTWTLQWQALGADRCLSPGEPRHCGAVQDVCGPSYHEQLPAVGMGAGQALEAVTATCLSQPHNPRWYRFIAQRDGLLEFELRPDRSREDLDWVLLRADPKHPATCPDLEMATHKLACNFAGGSGQAGTTGMGPMGEGLASGAGDCPFATQIQARKGDIFFLLVDHWSLNGAGFELRFNDVVAACNNPPQELMCIDTWRSPMAARPEPRNTFTQYTRVLRIDLNEKANAGLQDAPLPADMFAETTTGYKSVGTRAELPQYKGLAQALIQGLRVGAVHAVSAHDLATPVHYGDLLALAARADADSSRKATDSLPGLRWNCKPEALANFCQVIELIAEEKFDKSSGRTTHEIKYLRLIWSNPDHGAPDYNVAVFSYREVYGYLDKVQAGNGHNDVQFLSLKDLLETRQYNGVMVARAGKPVISLPQSLQATNQQFELQSYNWGR